MSDRRRQCAAIYARCATSGQDERPLLGQIDRARALLSAKGFELAGVYEDLNRSGTRLSDRSGLDGLLAALDQRAFGHLVVDDLQRLGSGGVNLLKVLDRLKATGVTLHCVAGSSELLSIEQQASCLRNYAAARGWEVVCVWPR